MLMLLISWYLEILQVIFDLTAAQRLQRYRQRNRTVLSFGMMHVVLKTKNRGDLSFYCFSRLNMLSLYYRCVLKSEMKYAYYIFRTV